MNRKIIVIAGVVFATAFIGVFLFIWSSTKTVIGIQADEVNSLYASETAFDMSVFDNRLVSGRSILNLKEEIETDTTAYSLKLTNMPEISEADVNKTYRATLSRNANGIIDGIEVELVE